MLRQSDGRDDFLEVVAVLDALPYIVLARSDADGAIYANRAFREHTGFAEAWTLAVHPNDRHAAAQRLTASQDAIADAGTLQLRDRNGVYRRFTVVAGRSEPSAPRHYVCLVFTAAEDAVGPSHALAAALSLREAMLDAVPDRIELIGRDGTLLHANRAGRAARASAGPAEQSTWLNSLPKAIQRRGHSALQAAAQGKRSRFRVVRDGPDSKVQHWQNTLIPIADAGGGTVAVVNIARDVTVQHEVRERLRSAGKIDVLTNVWTRREFKNLLQGSIARASVEGGSVGVLIADLDHFKHVNDIFGDPAGDHLLRTVCDRIKSLVPPGGYVARLGGDEFAVAIPDLRDEAQLLSLADDMLRLVDAPVIYQGAALRGAFSIGCAVYPRDAADMSGLLKCADAALTDLKDGGRGRAQAFAQRMLDDATLVAEQLRTAWDVVRRDVIIPFYQAKVQLDDRRIVGLEALLRWRGHDGTLRYPGGIAEAFNNFDLATRIADAMQEKVLADLARWLASGVAVVPVSINAAPVEFLRGDYAERLLGRLEHFAVPASLIEVEVTEHSLTARSAREVAHALRTLKAAGVRISLDDFGAGHSSLVHLRDYSINVLKLDRNFIAGMMVDPAMAAIVETICALAPRLGLEVVAEGVETEAQAEKLQPWGCRIGQGFLFGEALPADLTIERLGPT
jgi:diguanylate cyclase (GGDEF)-like protein